MKVFCLFAALGTVAMASPYDDCTKNYTYIKDDKCSQICLGEKVGVCPVKIVVEAGNLTAGTCPGAGYPHDTGTTQKVKAGPCGTITFEVYDKSTDDVSCTTYTHIQDGNCGQDCLGSMVGICPVAVVVAAGDLKEGTCPKAGYPVDTGGTQTVTAGPCGKLEFEVYHKKSITALDAPSGVYEGGVPLIIDVKVTINSGTSLDLDLNVKIIKDEVKCSGEATATSATDITFPNSGNTGDCMGDSLRNQHKDPSKVKLSINSDGSLTFHSPWPNLKLKKKSVFDAPSGVYEGGVPLIIDVKVTINSGTSLDLDLNVKIIKDEVKCSGEVTATSATDITFPNSGNTGDCMGDSLRNQHKDPSKVKLSINSDGSLTFHSPWPNLKLKKKSSVVVLK